jgi:hypothetical protein
MCRSLVTMWVPPNGTRAQHVVSLEMLVTETMSQQRRKV